MLLAVGISVALMIGGGSIALLLSDGGPSPVGWVTLVLAAPCALVALALVLLGQRPRFTVSTTGLEIRTPLRTRRLPWAEIAVVEVDHGWVHQGQTVVVLRDGRRIGAPITEARSARRRGERIADHGPGSREPAITTRAAIDAHRRWLRGELSGR
ncbi:PH domain-containing protein [Brachybacterium sp. AOP43-C2-M15]|uniref:PH domain-containing protein n=1 Tax=Brachybacterium sp. AOP43-C2-M15 TaxID=3457661 RepID=UPI0040341D75